MRLVTHECAQTLRGSNVGRCGTLQVSPLVGRERRAVDDVVQNVDVLDTQGDDDEAVDSRHPAAQEVGTEANKCLRCQRSILWTPSDKPSDRRKGENMLPGDCIHYVAQTNVPETYSFGLPGWPPFGRHRARFG